MEASPCPLDRFPSSVASGHLGGCPGTLLGNHLGVLCGGSVSPTAHTALTSPAPGEEDLVRFLVCRKGYFKTCLSPPFGFLILSSFKSQGLLIKYFPCFTRTYFLIVLCYFKQRVEVHVVRNSKDHVDVSPSYFFDPLWALEWC